MMDRDKNLRAVINDIETVIKNAIVCKDDKLLEIENIISSNRDLLEEQNFLEASKTEKREYFEIMEKKSIKVQNRLSPIIKVLDFQESSNSNALNNAIRHFKDTDGNIGINPPDSFLDKQHRDMIFENGKFRPSLYKGIFMNSIASSLKSGALNIDCSYKYLPIDDYLIPTEEWVIEREKFILKAGLKDFEDVSMVLKKLEKELSDQYEKTNNLYIDGKNPHLKVKENSQFTIATPKKDKEQEDDILQSFFPNQKLVPLIEVLATVNKFATFTDEFTPLQQRYTKNTTSPKIIYAGIIGKGCAIGTSKIANISSSIKEHNLQNLIRWCFSLENIRSANDKILGLTNNMELPQLYRKTIDTLHTASDGQKFTARKESLNANYSFKYFGKEQGVSAYTFIDERQLLWHSLVFSASARESMYVIDGLMQNDIVKSDIHSTDTHGYSEAIFATTHLLGFSYAPRIKNLKKQILYIFKNSSLKAKKSKWKIKPSKYINISAIKEGWEYILRMICTIKLKYSTASNIFQRLNSYSKQHVLYQALKAFGQIIKSIFILKYLDDLDLRQSIEKQLSKVELSNKFTRAVAVGDPHGFSEAEKEDQEINESCNRLIKNAIICWNYIYLTKKLYELRHKPEQRKILLQIISKHSVISWAHINMLGEYDFSDEKLQDSFNLRLLNLDLV